MRLFSNLIIGILVISSIVNMAGDVLLFSNYTGDNLGLNLNSLTHSNPKLILTGAFIGLLSIPVWFIPAFIFYKSLINKRVRNLTIASYVAYISGCLVYHFSYAFLGGSYFYQANENVLSYNVTAQNINSLFNIIAAFIFSAAIIYLAEKRKLYVSRKCYFLLPFTGIIFQVLCSRLIPIPAPLGGYIAMISGTLFVMFFFISLRFYKIK